MNKKFLKLYLLPILWAFLIFILSSIPGAEYPEPVFDYALIAHFVEFFVLAFLIARAIGAKGRKIYLAILIAFLYAISDETHQLFVASRSFSWIDLLVDLESIIIGVWFWLYLKRGKIKM